MKSTVLWALVVLNAGLLLLLIGRFTHANAAMAQPAARRGDYLMIPAQVISSSSGIVVMVDQANGELSAMSYDDSARRLVTMAKIDLTQVFQRGTGGRNPGSK